MIKILILLFLPFYSMEQSLTETVKQINDLLKAHTFNIQTPSDVDVRSYDQISVDNKGQLTMLNYLKNPKTHTIGYTPVQSFSYLKNLNICDTEDLENGSFVLSINCSSKENCISLPETAMLSASKENTINLRLENADAREKCKSAFSHLLYLAKSNKEFKN